MREAQTMECDSKWMRAAAAGLTRRRAIRIVAAAARLPLMIAAVRACPPLGTQPDLGGVTNQFRILTAHRTPRL
jgi:hypothetical protein